MLSLIAASVLCAASAAAQDGAPNNTAFVVQVPWSTAAWLVVLVLAGAAVRLVLSARRDSAAPELAIESRMLQAVVVGTKRTERIPRAEVAKHNTKADCWIVVHDLVLDVSHYARVHPGGQSILTDTAGADATKGFDTVHELQDIEEAAPEVIIGVVSD